MAIFLSIKLDEEIILSYISVFQGQQPLITRYSPMTKARVMHRIWMSGTCRYFWTKRTWCLITPHWASRHVTCAVITSSVCSISIPLVRSALEGRLSRPWNRLLQSSMKQKLQVSRSVFFSRRVKRAGPLTFFLFSFLPSFLSFFLWKTAMFNSMIAIY